MPEKAWSWRPKSLQGARGALGLVNLGHGEGSSRGRGAIVANAKSSLPLTLSSQPGKAAQGAPDTPIL